MFAFFAALFVMSFPAESAAQQVVSISGKVSDEQGPLDGVTVT